MSIVKDARQQDRFSENELVMWRQRDGNKQVPIPAVVVRNETAGVIIRARIQGKLEEFNVDPEQLISR